MHPLLFVTASLLTWSSSAVIVTIHPQDENQPLRQAPVLQSANGALSTTISLDAVHIVGRQLDLVTRAFNASIPPPTLAVLPGDKLAILLVNNLANPLGSDMANNFHHPNYTNLHLHGLHVSETPPSDDVLFTELRPGDHYQYEYTLLAGHSPGTYWYHPHHHGSQVQQTGAGAAGALLVLDPVGFLSSQLASMEDKVLLLQHLQGDVLAGAAKGSGDELLRVNDFPQGPGLMMVNGAPLPVVTMRPQEWQRWRFILDSVGAWTNLQFGACEVALLAKDGIYIHDFPRTIAHVTLPPGGRADVLVRCPEGEVHSVTAVASPNAGLKTFIGTVLTVHVQGLKPQGLTGQELQSWVPPIRPKYLEDTLSADPGCSCETRLGLDGISKGLNEHLWSGPKAYMHNSPVDEVIERKLDGVSKHPYHQHTFPFQLIDIPTNDPYFKVGDWHDSYLNVWSTKATIRFRTVDFSGPYLVHCHHLGHSDKGMMAVEHVGGTGRNQCSCDLLNQGFVGQAMGFMARAGDSKQQVGVKVLVALTSFIFCFFVIAAGVRVLRRASKGMRRCCARDYVALPEGQEARL